jgi:hypothetical protein
MSICPIGKFKNTAIKIFFVLIITRLLKYPSMPKWNLDDIPTWKKYLLAVFVVLVVVAVIYLSIENCIDGFYEAPPEFCQRAGVEKIYAYVMDGNILVVMADEDGVAYKNSSPFTMEKRDGRKMFLSELPGMPREMVLEQPNPDTLNLFSIADMGDISTSHLLLVRS